MSNTKFVRTVLLALVTVVAIGCTYEEPCGTVFFEIVNYSRDEIFVYVNDGYPENVGDRCYHPYYGSLCPHLFYPGERRNYTVKPHENTLVFVWAKDYYPVDSLVKVPDAGLSMEEFDTQKDKKVTGISIIRTQGNERESCWFQLTIKPNTGNEKALSKSAGQPKKYKMELSEI